MSPRVRVRHDGEEEDEEEDGHEVGHLEVPDPPGPQGAWRVRHAVSVPMLSLLDTSGSRCQ